MSVTLEPIEKLATKLGESFCCHQCCNVLRSPIKGLIVLALAYFHDYEGDSTTLINKRSMGHIAHLRNQLKSTFERSYDFTHYKIGPVVQQ